MRYWSLAAIVVMAISGCQTRTEYYGGNGNGNGNGRPGGGVEPVITLKERTDWSVAYRDRTDYREQDGTISRVEEFNVNYTGANYFIVRTFTDEDMKNFYNNDIQSLLEGEVKDIVTIADNQNIKFYEMNTLVFDKNTHSILFDLLLHGSYTAWLIEMSADGKPTYNYAKAAFTVREEEAIDAYLAWVGTWHYTDGYSAFDITVSPAENNYLYYVDGWETGPAVSAQNADWLYARYRNQDQNLYFYAQTIGDAEDTDLKTWITKCFMGSYLSSEAPSDGVGLVDGEGVDWQADIAHTAVAADGTVSVVPLTITFDNGFTVAYHSMRLSRLCWDENNWAHYNVGGVPVFTGHTVTMTKVKATVAPRERVRTKAVVNRLQPRRHVSPSVRTKNL